MFELNTKNINVEDLASEAIRNEELISVLLKGVINKSELIRYNSSNVLDVISQKNPEILYPKFDYFVEMLGSSNAYHQSCAIELIANLACSDPEKKFENIFNRYFDILKNEKTIPSAYLARNSGKIALAKPDLREKITKILLSIDLLHKGKQVELIKSYAIESIDQYFEFIEQQNDIIEFIKNQINSQSPKTRKVAQKFLKKWNLK